MTSQVSLLLIEEGGKATQVIRGLTDDESYPATWKALAGGDIRLSAESGWIESGMLLRDVGVCPEFELVTPDFYGPGNPSMTTLEAGEACIELLDPCTPGTGECDSYEVVRCGEGPGCGGL